LDEDAQARSRPQLIVEVETTVANVPDVEMTAIIQAKLVKADLKPEEHNIRPKQAHEALQARRQEQETSAWRLAYQTRAGIEGTLSQAVRGMGRRRARYDGLPKVHLQHVLTAVAINMVRIDAVLTNTPRGKTRHTHFAMLASRPSLPEQISA